MFGSTGETQNWHLKNIPASIAQMAGMYLDTMEMSQYYEDYEQGEQIQEEVYVGK